MQVNVPDEQKAAFVFADSANATLYFREKVCGARRSSEDDVLSKAEGRAGVTLALSQERCRCTINPLCRSIQVILPKLNIRI